MKREADWRGNWSRLARAVAVVGVVVVGAVVVSCANGATSYTPILQPTIFWHDNQWETYENGQWVPYHDPARNQVVMEPESAEILAPEEPQGPEMVDTSGFVPAYGWGFIGAPAFYRPHHHRLARGHVEHRRPEAGMSRRNVRPGPAPTGLGRVNVGIGQPNVGMGRTTIGIGQPNVGVGKNNAGIGQPTVGIGQTTIGIGQQMGSQRGGWGR